MTYEIVPSTSVGPLQLGMTVDEVRALLPALPRAPREGDPPHRVDAFEALGIEVFYGAAGRCEGLELAAPAAPTLDGHPLLGIPLASAEALLRQRDPMLEVDERGLVSFAIGIALYCPGHHVDGARPVVGVLVFAPTG